MKTATEAKKITKEIAELLPGISMNVKEEMLIILRWENAKKKNGEMRETTDKEKEPA